MASSKEYLDFVLEQLSDLDGITVRPMMGECLLYVDGRLAGGVYDNRLLVKPVPSAAAYVGEPVYQLPYEGAKPMLFVENMDDRAWLAGLLRTMRDELPEPKKKTVKPVKKEERKMTDEVRLGNVMVDCGDEQALQSFYGQLLNWETATLFGRPAVRSAEGVVFLFCQEEDYVPPVWPEKDGCQQKQMHFDFQVDSVPEAVEKALKLGAVKAPVQYGGEQFVTLLDPAGHPFCLCRKEKKVSTAAIRRVDSPEEKRRISREILESLPEWFGIPEAREEYIAESTGQTFFAAKKDGSAVGFLCLKQTGPKTVELAVMGVRREAHRQGIGTALAEAAREEARRQGNTLMQVKTVAMGHYAEYDATNRFYQSLGFQELEIFPTLWGEKNPCQIYVMPL